MKRAVMLYILAFLMMPITVYAAPDRTGKLDAGVNVSGAIQTDSDLDSTIYVGGTLAYGVSPWLALGVESGWMESGAELDLGNGLKVEAGDLTGIPLFGDIIVRVPIE